MRTIALSMVAILIAGCASAGNSDLADEQIMARIKVGESTKQQVTSLLGDPDNRRTIEVGGAMREWWSYSYASAMINPLDYLLLYGLWFNGIGTYDTRYEVGVFFDHRDVVSSLSRTRTDYDMGRPFSSGEIASNSKRTSRDAEPARGLIHFEDRAQFRF